MQSITATSNSPSSSTSSITPPTPISSPKHPQHHGSIPTGATPPPPPTLNLEQIKHEYLSALDTMLNQANTDNILAADQWIQRFQTQQYAWSILDNILHTQNLPQAAYINAAQLLRKKLQRDWNDLPDTSSRISFRDSLLTHVQQFRHSAQAIRTQLALCTATCALMMIGNHEWSTALHDLTTNLGQSSDTALILLDILAEIAEECGERKVDLNEQTRENINAQLASQAKDLFDLLFNYFSHASSAPTVQAKVLQCLSAWMYAVKIPLRMVCSHPLLAVAFQSIGVPNLEQPSLAVIIELMKVINSHRNDAFLPHPQNMNGYPSTIPNVSESESEEADQLMHQLIPRIIDLFPSYVDAVNKKDDQKAKYLCQLFCNCGEIFRSFVAGASPLALKLVEIITQTAAHPNKQEIASYTYDFWMLFVEDLSRTSRTYAYESSSQSSGSEYSDIQTVMQQQLERHFAPFAPYMMQMVDNILEVMRYPEDLNTISAADRDEYKRCRYYSVDALINMCIGLGFISVLQRINTLFLEAVTAWRTNPLKYWKNLEGRLYAIRSVGSKLKPERDPRARRILDDLIGQILGTLVTFTREIETMPHDPNMSPAESARSPNTPKAYLMYTVLLIIGSYSLWVNENPAFLPQLLSLAVHSMNEIPLQTPATHAFKFLCTDCANHLASSKESLSSLFTVYQHSTGLEVEEQQDIISALVSVSVTLELPLLQQSLEQVLAPCAHALQQIVNTAQSQPTAANSLISTLAPVLDRLTHIFLSLFKAYEPAEFETHRMYLPNISVQLCLSIWPYTEKILQLFGYDDPIMEKLCKHWKYAVRVGGSESHALVHVLVPALIQGHRQSAHSCFLYTTSQCIEHFGSQVDWQQFLSEVLAAFTASTLPLFEGLEGFTSNPDIADDYYDMLSKMCFHCPDVVMSSLLIKDILSRAIFGILSQHRNSSKSVLRFFNAFLMEGVDTNNFLARRRHPYSSNRGAIVQYWLQDNGLTLCSQIILLLITPSSTRDKDHCSLSVDIMEELVLIDSIGVVNWINATLLKLPEYIAHECRAFSSTISAQAEFLASLHAGQGSAGNATTSQLGSVHNAVNECVRRLMYRTDLSRR